MTTVARRAIPFVVSVGLVAAGIFCVPTGDAAPRTAVEPCSLTVVPAAMTAGRPNTRVLAEASRTVQGETDGSVPRASGIRVRGVEVDISPGSWIVELDLTEARPGDWRLTLTGRDFECSGRLTVRER